MLKWQLSPPFARPYGGPTARGVYVWRPHRCFLHSPQPSFWHRLCAGAFPLLLETANAALPAGKNNVASFARRFSLCLRPAAAARAPHGGAALATALTTAPLRASGLSRTLSASWLGAAR